MTATTDRTPAGWVARGALDASGFNAFLITVTMLGVGGLARDVGFPIGAALLSTLLIWAGPAQIILFASVAAGVALPAIALAVLVSSMRFLPMTVSLLPLTRSGHERAWQRGLAAHLCSMSTWVEGLRRLPALPVEARMPYYLGFAGCVISVATAATGFGFYLYGALPPAIGAALLFMSPMYFAASIARNALGLADWTAIILGFVLAPIAFTWLPSGVDLLAVGLIGGTAGFLVHMARKRAVEPGAPR